MQLGMAFASAMGHSKARQAWRGRKGWEERLLSASTQAKQNGKTGRWVHVHCASLGEYEQAAPVINKMREVAPGPANSAHLLFSFRQKCCGAYSGRPRGLSDLGHSESHATLSVGHSTFQTPFCEV